MTPDDPRHGTPAGRHVHKADNEPCCDPCRRAAARYEQELQLDRLNGRPRTVPARGTRRRIQALVALGHTFRTIGDALNMTDKGAQALARRPNQNVYATTAARVAALYDAWSMRLPAQTTPKERRAATYARTVATKNRWLPPLAWDDIDHDPRPVTGAVSRRPQPRPLYAVDHATVERALAGHSVRTNIAERREIVARARSWGWPLEVITQRTGITKPERYLPAPDEQVA